MASTPVRSITCGARMNVRIPAKRGMTCASSGLYGGPATLRAYCVRPLTRSSHGFASLGCVVGVTIAGSRRPRRALLALLATLAVVLCAPAGGSAATYAKGLDVSHYQGAIDWIQVVERRLQVRLRQGDRGHDADRSHVCDQPRRDERRGPPHRRLPLRAAGRLGRRRHRRQCDRAGGLLRRDRAPVAGDLPPVLDMEAKGGLSAANLLSGRRHGSTR